MLNITKFWTFDDVTNSDKNIADLQGIEIELLENETDLPKFETKISISGRVVSILGRSSSISDRAVSISIMSESNKRGLSTRLKLIATRDIEPICAYVCARVCYVCAYVCYEV